MKCSLRNRPVYFQVICYVFLVVILSMTACSKDSVSHQKLPSTELISPEYSGVHFNNALNDDPKGVNNILSFGYYYNGAGVGLGDFDNDGLVDLFFAGNEVDNRIYKNLGDLKFEDKTTSAGINQNKNWATGVSIVDINNDQLLDIYVSQGGPSGSKNNLFFINQGGFKFKEMAQSMGLADDNFGTQAAFLDYDKDGDLDIYTLNESQYEGENVGFILDQIKDEKNLRKTSGNLYRNDGNLRFSNVSKEANVLEQSFGLGIAVSDFNHDNYPDIYVANDYSVPDRLYINQKNGTFKDEIKKYTNQIAYFAMGIDIADINNDGFQEIAIVDMATSDHYRGKTLMQSMDSKLFNQLVHGLDYQYQYMFNAFQLNNGNGSYSNIAGFAGVQKTDWSWSSLLMDLNLDGKRDYFVSNGYKKYWGDNDFKIYLGKIKEQYGGNVPLNLREEIYAKMPTIPLRNLIFMNAGNLHFEQNPSYFAYPEAESFSYGTAYGDLDNDGDLELVVTNVDSKAHIIKNNARENNAGNYLTLKLKHPENSALCYNAKVKIYYDGQIQVAENSFTRGYLSSMDQRIFFGLGPAKKVDKIEILWPDDMIQIIENPSINQQLDILYSPGKKGTWEITSKKAVQLDPVAPSDIGISYQHQENQFEDFAKEVLLPQRQSTLGPSLAVGDMNNDGLDDIFLGGATGQKAQFYLQEKDGQFSLQDDVVFNYDRNTEDIDALFVDPNRDGTKEIIVASGGGGEMEGQDVLLHDRFYAFGGGKYNKISNVLPQEVKASYKIKSADLDQDGSDELLICGAAKPGKYPQSEASKLYRYQNNQYVDVTDAVIPRLSSIPLVRDVAFSHINEDQILDIIVVSEWGSPTIFCSDKDGNYTDQSDQYLSEKKHGWWSSVLAVDIDNDGDDDYILGNIGKNIKHKVKETKPLLLYANDFDDNGTLDVVLAKEYKGKIVPARGRECSSEQMPFITEKFESYSSFASADLVDILGEESIEASQKFQATDFGSYLLRNEQGKLVYEPLPDLAQIAPISSSVHVDINKDGYQDIIIGGNYYDTEYETPRQDAGRGLVLLNIQGKDFQALSPTESNLNLNGNFRKLALVQRASDQLLIASENNGPLKIYSISK